MAAASIGDGSQSAAVPRLVLTGAAAEVRLDATRVPLVRLDAALLAVLAVQGATSRQRLLQLLWSDDEPESARNALRQRLFRLRRAVGAELVTGGELLSLRAGVEHDLDADDAGELLAAHDYADCPSFEHWLDEQRGSWAHRRRERDAARIDAYEREGRYAEGAELAERCVAADPLDERAVQRLMRLRYIAGQRAAAIAAFERFASALHDDCGGVPARATAELLAVIRDARAPLPAPRREIPASVLRPPRLVGRDAELRRLHAAWGAGRAFWLLGEAGMGKTRLIAELVADAVEPAQALVVPARPGDAGVPYATLGRALRALLELRPLLLEGAQRGELARVMPELCGTGIASVALGQQLVLQRAIEALLRDAQGAGLQCIVIDDLHFADSASVEMLQGIVLADDLRWGFAQRPGEGSSSVDALRAALEEVQRLDAVALGPLDEAQLAELVESLGLHGADGARLAPQLARHTGGNPMYALETLKHLIVDGEGFDAALPRPASVGQLIERRLRRLTPQAVQLARVAAVAGTDFSIELAESVLGTKALALADAWRELEAAQVLRGAAFAHDLVYEATLAGVPAPIAQHTHGEVAAWLETHGSEPARVAAHWLGAAQPQRALKALHAAADAAKRAMRRKEEAEFLSRAAQIESDAGDQAAAFASLAGMIEATFVADLKALDAALFDRLDAAATTDGPRAHALAARANWLHECGELDHAERCARRAVELADAAGDEAIAAYARQRLAHVLDWQGHYEPAVAVYQQLLPWAAERASDTERAFFYSRFANVLDNTGRGREARVYHQRTIDLMRAASEWGWVVVVLDNLAASWAMAGYMQRALDALREALTLAAAHDEARGAGASLPASMFKRLRDCGRYDEALRWLDAALGTDPGMVSALTRCHVACGWLHLGQHARAQREIDAALKGEIPDWVRAKALQMRARLKLALGQRPGKLLDEALAIVQAQRGRQYLVAGIVLDHALTLPSADALVAARAVVAEGERLGLPGTVLAGHIRAMRFAVEARAAGDAAAHADAALAIGDDVMPNDLYPAELWHNAWQALRLAGREDDAAAALAGGVEWVRTTSRDHVPEVFRDSFARANAVNQQLLRAAAALA